MLALRYRRRRGGSIDTVHYKLGVSSFYIQRKLDVELKLKTSDTYTSVNIVSRHGLSGRLHLLSQKNQVKPKSQKI